MLLLRKYQYLYKFHFISPNVKDKITPRMIDTVQISIININLLEYIISEYITLKLISNLYNAFQIK